MNRSSPTLSCSPRWVSQSTISPPSRFLSTGIGKPCSFSVLPCGTSPEATKVGSVVIGARYVVDVGHDDMIVLARIASFSPKAVIAVQGAVIELLSSVRVVDLDGAGE